MATKPNIYGDVQGSRIGAVLPPEYSDLALRLPLTPEESYAVIVFPGMSNNGSHVIDSKSLSKALSKVAPNKSIAVFGHGFTQEAAAVLAERGVLGVGQSDFFWTDESWRRVSTPQKR